jgi:hypothetical protein
MYDSLNSGTLAIANVRDVAPRINKLLKFPFRQNIASSNFHTRNSQASIQAKNPSI